MGAMSELEDLIGDQAEEQVEDERASSVRVKGRSGKRAGKKPGWSMYRPPEKKATMCGTGKDEVQPWEGHPERLPKKPPGRK